MLNDIRVIGRVIWFGRQLVKGGGVMVTKEEPASNLWVQ